jgi:hypothetical protein
MRSIFGWDLPPGVSMRDLDPPECPCDVCGRLSNDCICPECPICDVPGDPGCYLDGSYTGHGLQRSLAQMAGLMRLEEEYRREVEADARYAKEWHDDV